MKRIVMVDGMECPVTVSDENEALQAAHAAGGAILGIWRIEDGLVEEGGPVEVGDPVEEDRPDTSGFDACLYLVTSEEDVTEELLEQTARRHLDLPWNIAVTERLLIREFRASDPLEPPSPHDGEGVFSDWEQREAYRKSQYRFGECGLWALVLREETGAEGRMIGKAGITDGELGYHIYPEYRGQGYALEACRAILFYAKEQMELETVTLKIKPENRASLALAEKLGFDVLLQNPSEICCILHVQRI